MTSTLISAAQDTCDEKKKNLVKTTVRRATPISSSPEIPRTRNVPASAWFKDFCVTRGFTGFSFPYIWTQIENGEVKKKMYEAPEWSEFNPENFHQYIKQHDKAFAIITGKQSGITVIDCDSVESYQAILRDYPELESSFIVQTANGFHIYVSYMSGVKNNTQSFRSYPDVDVRTDGGIIFAPPTTYKNCKSGQIERYSIVDASAEVCEFPKGLAADLDIDGSARRARLEAKKLARASSVNAAHVPKEANTSSEVIDEVGDTDCEFLANNEKASNAVQIKELLAKIDESYFDNRDEWLRIGAAIHWELGDTDEARQLFLEASQRAPRFANIVWSEIEAVWKSFKGSVAKPATIATLRFLCRDNARDDEAAGTESCGFDFGLITTTNLAKYIVELYGSDFIQSQALSEEGKHQNKLVWWDGNIWNASEAHRKMLQLIGNDVFFGLQKLAFDSISDEHYKAAVLKKLVKLQDRSFKESVLKDVLTTMEMSAIEFDTNQDQDNNLQFLNGVLMLDRVIIGPDGNPDCFNAFRPRKRTDYVTKTLDWEFDMELTDDTRLATDEVREMFRQIQPEPEQQRLQLSYLAYGLTGHTDAQKFKINIGYSASNGKSFECVTHENVFGLYTTKLHKATFTEGNPKTHKYLIELLCCPIRYAYIEELDRMKLDADLLKDFVSGGKMTVEVMFGTKASKRIQAKLSTNSNKDINVDVDKGVLRRGMMEYYESQFVDHPDPNSNPPQFLKVDKLEKRFLQQRYRRAYLELLLPHVVSYYQDGLYIPAFAGQQFESVTNEYDAFKTSLFDVCEPGTAQDRVWKDDIVDALKGSLGRGWTWTKVLPEIKRLGYIYKPLERVRPRNGGMESMRGVVVGLRWIGGAPRE